MDIILTAIKSEGYILILDKEKKGANVFDLRLPRTNTSNSSITIHNIENITSGIANFLEEETGKEYQ